MLPLASVSAGTAIPPPHCAALSPLLQFCLRVCAEEEEEEGEEEEEEDEEEEEEDEDQEEGGFGLPNYVSCRRGAWAQNRSCRCRLLLPPAAGTCQLCSRRLLIARPRPVMPSSPCLAPRSFVLSVCEVMRTR